MPPLSLLALEINAAWHCNLACVACSHASPVAETAFCDPEAVRRDLTHLATAVTVEELRIVGGEPLLHPNLAGLLHAVRASGIGGSLRVITNGTRLHLTGMAWVELVDEVHVSRYPGTHIRQDALDRLEETGRQHGKEIVVKDYHSFRQVWPAMPLGPADTQAVFDTCQVAHAWACHTVQDGKVSLCPMSVRPDASDDQACPIKPLDTLRERLAAFLDRTTPLNACTSCLGTVGNKVPHQQATGKTWVTLSRKGTIDREHLELSRGNKWLDNGCSDNDIRVVPAELRA